VKKERRREKKEKKSLEIKSNKNGHKKIRRRRRRKTVDMASVALVRYIRIQRVCVSRSFAASIIETSRLFIFSFC